MTLIKPTGALFLILASRAIAGNIPISNPSFEQDNLACLPGPGCFAGIVSGWNHSGVTATFKPNTTGSEFSGPVPDAVQVEAVGASVGGGEIDQSLGVPVTASTTYTLSFWVGHRIDATFTPLYTASLLA